MSIDGIFKISRQSVPTRPKKKGRTIEFYDPLKIRPRSKIIEKKPAIKSNKGESIINSIDS